MMYASGTHDVALYSVLRVSLNILTVDRFQTFPKDFIDRNPHIFLNFEWINIHKLKIFIESESLGVHVFPAAVN